MGLFLQAIYVWNILLTSVRVNTLFRNIAFIRTGTLIAASHAPSSVTAQDFFFFLTGTSSLMCHG